MVANRTDGDVNVKRALETYVRLQRATDSVTARVFQLAPLPKDLTMPQFAVLEALLHLGPMCQASLGRKLLRTKGNVSLVVDNLTAGGLVERRASPHDRRQNEIFLTETGRRVITEYFPRHARAIESALSVLTEQDRQKLGDLCRRLGLSLEEIRSKEEHNED